MAQRKPASPEDASTATVLGWVIPRPTGRWHQAFVVTNSHVWVMPELSFAANEEMEAAASGGRASLHDYVRRTGWVTRPQRLNVSAVRSVSWTHETGMMRIAGDDEVIGAMIPERGRGAHIKPALEKAVMLHRLNAGVRADPSLPDRK